MIEMCSFCNLNFIPTFQVWELYRDRLLKKGKRIFNFMQIMARIEVRLLNGCFSCSLYDSHGLRGGEWSDKEGAAN